MMLFRRIFFYAVIGVIIFLLGATSSSLTQGDNWTQKADMPTARMGHTTCAVEEKIYAIGGYQKANAPGLTTVEVPGAWL